MTLCNFCWGSHGCSLEKDHEGTVHQCQVTFTEDDEQETKTTYLCTEYDEARPADARVRWYQGEDNEWGTWSEYGEGFRL